MNKESKNVRYKQLVEERKKYDFKGHNIRNPSTLSLSNDEHLNAWAYWHGDLDAEILFIGQDFGNEDYYRKYDGIDDPNNSTNKNVKLLFKQAGIDLDKPEQRKLYFTNAVLGAKDGNMSAPIQKSWYADTTMKFLKPLIEIIQPRFIIVMGAIAYDAISKIYGTQKTCMSETVALNPTLLPDGKKLLVVYHCSNLGLRNRNFNQQKKDWEIIGSELK